MSSLPKAFQDRESPFQQLAENITQVLWVKSLAPDALLYISPVYEKIWGRPLENLFRLPDLFLDSVYETDRERFREHLNKQRRGEFSEIDYRIQRPDGPVRWIRDRSFPIRDANGRAYRSAGISEDITDSKKTEEQNQKQQKFLAKAQAMAHLGSFEWNLCDNKVIWSEELYRIYGLNPGEFGATFEAFMDRLHPDDRERVKINIETAFRECKSFHLEERIIHSDGTPRVLMTQGEPLFDEKGNPVGIIGVCQDITEHKRIEEQLRQYTGGLEKLVETRTAKIQELERQRTESEKLTAAGRMAARIAHEINNPLAGIQSSFQLLKDAIPPTHRYYNYAGIIEREIERIANIIRQMYDLYRPEKETVRPFRLAQAINDILALLAATARERGVTIEADLSPADITITLSEGLLRQVLYNLLQNAIEASLPGQVVGIAATIQNQRFIVTITDQGIGIPEEFRSQVFEPFFTTKDTRQHIGGLGLGLSITNNIVEAMGGTIRFDSQVKHGTVFTVDLPI